MSQLERLSSTFKESLDKMYADLLAKQQAKLDVRVAMDQTEVPSDYEEVSDSKETPPGIADK